MLLLAVRGFSLILWRVGAGKGHVYGERRLMRQNITCPECGHAIREYKNPVPTVDIVIVHRENGIALVRRRFEPLGWALPGGFVDYGESVETAAIREAKEETGLDVRLKTLLGVYSDPSRDARLHTISTVFVAELVVSGAERHIQGGDDAAEAHFFPLCALPQPLAFDHAGIIADFSRRFASEFGLVPLAG